jgi:hypothetical protein
MSMFELLYGNTPENLILDIDPEARELIDDVEFELDCLSLENN